MLLLDHPGLVLGMFVEVSKGICLCLSLLREALAIRTRIARHEPRLDVSHGRETASSLMIRSRVDCLLWSP